MQIYVEGHSTHAVQTAWAMLALLHAGQVQFVHQILVTPNEYSLDIKSDVFE